MSEFVSSPIIGVERWEPGEKRPSVGRVPPERCPFANHDLSAPGSFREGWSPDDGGMVEYTCWACYRARAPQSSWRVARDEDAMWQAAGLPRPARKRPKYQGT
ncbi:hypothetical protein [Amycolatopsis thermoflava]|uniref:hypothetical protein n=1 Tax=Amycolatopsis thermoflava TaxID=84480 RepID=UPI0003FB19F3|nr:hypothetical protein [Amycolatopsis thermoflava]